MKEGQMVTVPLWGIIRPKSGDDYRPPEGVVLRGRLRQLQGGQVTGEMDADFLYSAGG